MTGGESACAVSPTSVVPIAALFINGGFCGSSPMRNGASGRRKVPTIKVGERFFACSPFDPYRLSSELNIPLNK